jgi:hypothetical protein
MARRRRVTTMLSRGGTGTWGARLLALAVMVAVLPQGGATAA